MRTSVVYLAATLVALAAAAPLPADDTVTINREPIESDPIVRTEEYRAYAKGENEKRQIEINREPIESDPIVRTEEYRAYAKGDNEKRQVEINREPITDPIVRTEEYRAYAKGETEKRSLY